MKLKKNVRADLDRVTEIRERLEDMNTLIITGQSGDAQKSDFMREAAKLYRELKDLGATVETPSAFLTAAAVKAGIPVVKAAGEERVESQPEPAPAESERAKPKAR